MKSFIPGQHEFSLVLIQEDDDGATKDSKTEAAKTTTAADRIIFGVNSLLNFNALRDTPCISVIHRHIMTKLQKQQDSIPAAVYKKFQEVLGNESALEADNPLPMVGFLINERFINIPPQVSLPMFQNLVTETNRWPDKFKYYLMIVNLMLPSKQSNGNASGQSDADDFYVKAEEELIDEMAKWSFAYTVDNDGSHPDDDDEDMEMIPQRKVILFEAPLLPQIVASMRTILREVYGESLDCKT